MTTARDTYNQIVYAKEQGLEEGRKEGREEGERKGREEEREEGLKEGKIEIARKMIEMGMAVNTIAIATGLTPPEIESLEKKH